MNRSVSQFILRRRGFTLIELMISLALMVLLMLGVNFIFTAVGGATSSAQVLSKIGRDIQAAQNVMATDFSQIAMKDGPTFQITSIVRPAFMTKQDQLGDGDRDPSTELLNPTDPSESNVIPAIPGSRAHRLDLLSFFARGNFHRQTGNDDRFVSDMSSGEAWIWYGHLRINGSGSFSANAQDPGTPWAKAQPSAGTAVNPDNYFAGQWILGRVPVLLIDKDIDSGATGSGTLNTGGGRVLDNSGDAQGFVNRSWRETDAAISPGNLSPLEYSSGTNSYPLTNYDPRFGSAATFAKIQSGRFDVASTTIDQFRNRLNLVLDAWNEGTGPLAFSPPGDGWWAKMFASDGRRFQCNPFMVKPISAPAFSQQRGVFLSGCTQFIVEYAGDFVHQNVTTGVVDNWFGDNTPANPIPKTDGEIDYIPAMTVAPFLPRQIRWYGMPRSITTSNNLNAQSGDVVPLRDLISTLSGVTTAWGGAPFEKHLPTASPSSNYLAGSSRLEFLENNPTAGSPPILDSNYVCAWGPRDTVRPTLIRIVMVLDDPNGRLKNGLTFEYVYKVQ